MLIELWESLPSMTQKTANSLLLFLMGFISVLLTVNGVLLYDWKTTTEARIAGLETQYARLAVIESQVALLMQAWIVDRKQKEVK